MSTSKLYSIASSNPIFASLEQPTLEAILAAGSLREYQSGSFVTLAGDVWPYLFLVVSGKVSAFKESSEGRSLVVETFAAGEIFWGLALFHENAAMPAALQAREDSQAYLWARERILPVFLQNGAVTWELSRLMIRRLLRASEVVEALAFQPLTGRVAHLLLESVPAGQETAARHLTLDEMAARVGTTREVVCRILYRFAEQGAIQINRTEFVFKNRQALEAQAQGGAKG